MPHHTGQPPTLSTDQVSGVYPDRDSFRRLAARGAFIPVYKEIIADTDTPVSALHKLRPDRYAYLLESVEGGERVGRYSFVGASAAAIFRAYNKRVEIETQQGSIESFATDDPMTTLEALIEKYRPVEVPGLPRFFGGAVGYIGYDVVRYWHPLGEVKHDGLGLPEATFLITDSVLIFDHVRGKIQIVVNAPVADDPDTAYTEAVAEIDRILHLLRTTAVTLTPLDQALNGRNADVDYTSNVTPDEFKASVQQAQAAIESGEASQIVVSQRLAMPMKSEPFDLYRILRTVNPSPYMFYLKLDDLSIVGSSPEVMVRVEDGEAWLRPIAGTRPRGATSAEDDALSKELLADEKERAEHLMLVDLGREELNRVCEPDSVTTDEFMIVERYSHVMHIVSSLKGRLASGRTSFDLLRATFPAGTLTGSPKVRAMQLIDELEHTNRGPYGGAIGYFGFTDNMDLCITIRTAVIHNDTAYVQAGAGIVADSDPEAEYQESLNKAKGLLKALAAAETTSVTD